MLTGFRFRMTFLISLSSPVVPPVCATVGPPAVCTLGLAGFDEEATPAG